MDGSSKKADKSLRILSAVYYEDVYRNRRMKDLTLPFDLLALSRLQLQATYHFSIYKKIQSASANAVNESLEADVVSFQLPEC